MTFAKFGACAVVALLALGACAKSSDSSSAGASATPLSVGGKVYQTNCSSCHQTNGQGVPGTFPPLAGNDVVVGDASKVIHIVKYGLTGKITVGANSYGGIMPAGLFLYWITATLIQIVQQYLILGWGGMFPLFGWYPEFARGHTPRFPVQTPTAKPFIPGQSTGAAERSKSVDRDLAARSTIRPNRTRSGRRGRRR